MHWTLEQSGSAGARPFAAVKIVSRSCGVAKTASTGARKGVKAAGVRPSAALTWLMSLESIALLVGVVGLVVYLLASLIFPERF